MCFFKLRESSRTQHHQANTLRGWSHLLRMSDQGKSQLPRTLREFGDL